MVIGLGNMLNPMYVPLLEGAGRPLRLAGPANPTNSTSASFTWTGSDNLTLRGSLVYSYRLDGGSWSSWANTTSTSYSGLGEGSHTFEIKARDKTGNEDLSPASWTWLIDTTAPATTMTIESVRVVLVRQGANYVAQATVTIIAGGNPVQGATVSGYWSEATQDTDSGITDANGKVVVLSDKVRKPLSGMVFTFTVTSVLHPDFLWDGVSKSGSAPVP